MNMSGMSVHIVSVAYNLWQTYLIEPEKGKPIRYYRTDILYHCRVTYLHFRTNGVNSGPFSIHVSGSGEANSPVSLVIGYHLLPFQMIGQLERRIESLNTELRLQNTQSMEDEAEITRHAEKTRWLSQEMQFYKLQAEISIKNICAETNRVSRSYKSIIKWINK